MLENNSGTFLHDKHWKPENPTSFVQVGVVARQRAHGMVVDP